MADPVTRISNKDLEKALADIRSNVGSYSSSKDLREYVPGFGTQKGIYKPKGSEYALWIRHTLKGPYPDKELIPLPDGSWNYEYSPEGNKNSIDFSLSTNKALRRSMEGGVPIAVFIQRDIPGSKSMYEVMGLAYVIGYDETHFRIHGEPIDMEAKPIDEYDIPAFEPFEPSFMRLTMSLKRQRVKLFQTGIRRLYHEKCSLCEIGYHFNGQPIGLEAAHLIPFSDNGTSKDLRNGILLCNNHHALFDENLWTFDEDYRVIVKDDKIFRKSAQSNHILKAEGSRLPNLPDIEFDLPAIEAIKFRLDHFW